MSRATKALAALAALAASSAAHPPPPRSPARVGGELLAASSADGRNLTTPQSARRIFPLRAGWTTRRRAVLLVPPHVSRGTAPSSCCDLGARRMSLTSRRPRTMTQSSSRPCPRLSPVRMRAGRRTTSCGSLADRSAGRRERAVAPIMLSFQRTRTLVHLDEGQDFGDLSDARCSPRRPARVNRVSRGSEKPPPRGVLPDVGREPGCVIFA